MSRAVRICVSLCLAAVLAGELLAAPLTTYDQRQEGDFNVHAHLENFVIVLIPSGTGGLLDFAAKSSPAKLNQIKRLISHGDGYSHVRHATQNVEEQPSSESVPEKSPIKVDIVEEIKVKEPVSKLHLEISAPQANIDSPGKDLSEHEVVIAQSPSVSLTKPQDKEKEKEKPASESSETEAEAQDKPSAAAVPVPVSVPVPAEVASETRARAAKLERLREGLEECSPREARDGSGGCRPIRPQNRGSKGFPSSDLLKSLRFGLSPAN